MSDDKTPQEEASKEKRKFQVGDSVTLKTGKGPLMMITGFEIDEETKTINWDRAICSWTKGKKEYTATYDVDNLMLDGPSLLILLLIPSNDFIILELLVF